MNRMAKKHLRHRRCDIVLVASTETHHLGLAAIVSNVQEDRGLHNTITLRNDLRQDALHFCEPAKPTHEMPHTRPANLFKKDNHVNPGVLPPIKNKLLSNPSERKETAHH